MRLLLVQMNSVVGDFEKNYRKMLQFLDSANSEDLVIFPECALCGYPPQDLLDYASFAKQSEAYAEKLRQEASSKNFIFGTVTRNSGRGRPLCNSAFFASQGKWLGKYEKRLLPTYDVFDEDRFFEAGQKPLVVDFQNEKIGITVCEDIWGHFSGLDASALLNLQNRYNQNPLEDSSAATLWVNISASPYEAPKVESKFQMLSGIAKKYSKRLIYLNAVGANDSLIFDGRSYVFSANGECLYEGKAFSEEMIPLDLESLKSPIARSQPSETADIYDALTLGIQDYCFKQGFTNCYIGLSGGIDSSVVTCLAVDALGKDNVVGILMPSRFTSRESNEDALAMSKAIQNPIHLIHIEEIFQASLRTMSKAFEGTDAGVAEENLQARARGMILMALANKFGGLVMTTGNKSELAVGYCTLYGDMCGALGPISDVYKTQVYALGREANRRWQRIPERVFTKLPSAELRHQQTDQDKLPPYEILDRILHAILEDCKSEEDLVAAGDDAALVQKILGWVRTSEFKRFQMALGLKVSSKAFGIGRRIPIVHRFF